MAWDHNTDKLYWACSRDGMTYFLELNPETAEPTLVRYLTVSSAGLYIRPQEKGSIFAPTDQVTSVELDRTQTRTLPGNAVRLDRHSLALDGQQRMLSHGPAPIRPLPPSTATAR